MAQWLPNNGTGGPKERRGIVPSCDRGVSDGAADVLVKRYVHSKVARQLGLLGISGRGVRECGAGRVWR